MPSLRASGCILYAFVILLCVKSVEASIIRYDFTANVTYTQSTPFGLTASPGDLVTGYFQYSTTLPDASPLDSSYGTYYGAEGGFTLNGHTVSSSSVGLVEVYDINAPNDIFQFIDGQSQSGGQLILDGTPQSAGYFYFGFIDYTAGLTDSLPSASQLASLTNFYAAITNGITTVHGTTLIDFSDLQTFTITETSDPVPEPASIALWGIGALGCVTWRRMRGQLSRPFWNVPRKLIHVL